MKQGPNPRIFLLLTVVALLVGVTAVYFQYQAYSSTKADVAKLRKQVRDEARVSQDLEDSRAKVAESAQRLQHLEAGVPQVAYIPTMLKELELTGRQHGIAVTGVKPVPKKKSSKKDTKSTGPPKRQAYDSIDIEVEGRGSFNAVMRFLSALENFPKIVSVRAVSVMPKADRSNPDGGVSLMMTVNIRAFVFPPDANGIAPVRAPGGKDGISES